MTDPFLPAFKSGEGAAVAPQFFYHEGEECVKVLIGGNSRFIPVFPAHEVWAQGDYGETQTYAERWPEQYRQFKEGSAQTAGGTPLEDAPFLDASRINDLRALKIFSIEGLAQFDDRSIFKLGGNGYRLKELAQEYLAKHASGTPSALQAQIDRMAAELAALKGGATGAPALPNEFMAADDPRTDEELKEAIAAKHGSRPRGQPSRATLLNMLAQDAAA